jgi:hypothetical protein
MAPLRSALPPPSGMPDIVFDAPLRGLPPRGPSLGGIRLDPLMFRPRGSRPTGPQEDPNMLAALLANDRMRSLEFGGTPLPSRPQSRPTNPLEASLKARSTLLYPGQALPRPSTPLEGAFPEPPLEGTATPQRKSEGEEEEGEGFAPADAETAAAPRAGSEAPHLSIKEQAAIKSQLVLQQQQLQLLEQQQLERNQQHTPGREAARLQLEGSQRRDVEALKVRRGGGGEGRT